MNRTPVPEHLLFLGDLEVPTRPGGMKLVLVLVDERKEKKKKQLLRSSVADSNKKNHSTVTYRCPSSHQR